PKQTQRGARAAASETAGARSAAAPQEPSQAGLREHLGRLLNPLDAVVLTRERLQEIVDDAVRRGRMTHADAAELVGEIFARGRRGTEEVLADIDQLLGGPADRVRREVGRARRATGITGGAFPIPGYENMTAAQVQSRLGELTPGELRRV